MRYEEHLTNIFADKVVAMRMVKLGGYTVFLFLVWIRLPSDGLQLHNKKKYPLRSESPPGQKSVVHLALGDK
jgi:hypothetical protein